uniref:Malic enzyme n=1 Tax=Grateloupia catenata TaxID=118369 RepID=A0A097IUG0_9FLOR|nr:malic enzyme [Grateloupia catenata]
MPHPVLANPAQNRGRRFSYAEREQNNLVGLVHPAPPRTLHQEVSRLLHALRSLPTALARYQFLMRVLEDDQSLFFAAAQANLPKILPIIYTPTVGDACLSYSDLPIPLRGLWIDSQQRGRIDAVLRNWPKRDIDVVVVSDCERILGLGDLGANGMGIPVGKLLLYSACGGINPDRCLPVVLDVGCNNPSIRNNEHYIGLPQDRLTGQAYDDFIQEFMDAIVERYGNTCLIQFEDFGNGNALRLLEQYRDRNCCFNDDVQGTAAVGLAGILSALRIEGVPSALSEHKFLFLGAGSAGIGIARLIVLALMREGMSEDDANKKCFFVDSRGLVYQGRERVTPAKATFAHEIGDDVKAVAGEGLEAIVKALRPTALIGVSTIPGSFTEGVIKEMGEINERPLIFALSNPTSKAECTAEAAYKHTDGRAIFASGSPFAPVKLDERRTLVPGQGNNSYIFPGLGLGIVTAGARHVPESMLLAASDSLSKLVDKEQLAVSCVYPDLNSLMDISAHIAMAVCKEAKRLGLNEKNVDDITVEKIRSQMFEPGRGLM